MTTSEERQITRQNYGHILTNTGVWSPDGQWIVYDVRSTASGDQFDGDRIEMVHMQTGEIRVLYHAKYGAHCGVITFNPRANRVAFILGPEYPSRDWEYCAWHRRGVMVDTDKPGQALNLDARDLVAPYTPGALRGGSHVHVWDPAGEWVSFTYEDHVLAGFQDETDDHENNLRNVGVSAPLRSVQLQHTHPRNHDGSFFTVLATRTRAHPRPGSDDIDRACEEGWIGTQGYVRVDGTRQRHALAFQGQVHTMKGSSVYEVFVVDLPEDLQTPGDGPLEGTASRRPQPPRGTVQRRLTFTENRKYPGLQGPRHWLRSSPDGARIACLMKDDQGIVQLWTVSPAGGPATQLTSNRYSIGSAFTWDATGHWIAHVMDNSVCVTDTQSGQTRRLTGRADEVTAPRPEACVFDPTGRRIAYVRPVRVQGRLINQIYVVGLND